MGCFQLTAFRPPRRFQQTPLKSTGSLSPLSPLWFDPCPRSVGLTTENTEKEVCDGPDVHRSKPQTICTTPARRFRISYTRPDPGEPQVRCYRIADNPASLKTLAVSRSCRSNGAVDGLNSRPGLEAGSAHGSTQGGTENYGGKSLALGAIEGSPNRHGSPGGSPYLRSVHWPCCLLNINNLGRARLLPSLGRIEQRRFRIGEAPGPSAGPQGL